MLLGIRSLSDLALGDAPDEPFIRPVFPQTAGDLIVVNTTVEGFGATDVTSQTFLYAGVNKLSADRVLQFGAIFVLEAGFSMADAPNPLLTLFFTAPTGDKLIYQSPYVYVGSPNLSTYLGVLADSTYCVFVFGPNILVRGLWKAQLQFQPTPQDLPVLSEVGYFTIPISRPCS